VGCDGRIKKKKQRIDKSAAGMVALFLWAIGLYSWGFNVGDSMLPRNTEFSG
jgi:hypothetical protein